MKVITEMSLKAMTVKEKLATLADVCHSAGIKFVMIAHNTEGVGMAISDDFTEADVIIIEACMESVTDILSDPDPSLN